MQLDEKWSFVERKQKHCDLENPADHHRGDCWDHVAFDAENRLVLGVICGKRSGSRVLKLLQQLKRQLGGRTPKLITSDNFGPYATCVELVFGNPPRPYLGRQDKSRPARPAAELNYATVNKRRENGRVVEVTTEVIFGTKRSVARALKASSASSSVNTSFVERHNGTDRHRNARKVRRTYRFSKDWEMHEAVTHFTYYSYNFCWPVRTLRQRQRTRGGKPGKPKWRPRTPAMAAGLADHIWTLREWLSRPVTGLST